MRIISTRWGEAYKPAISATSEQAPWLQLTEWTRFKGHSLKLATRLIDIPSTTLIGVQPIDNNNGNTPDLEPPLALILESFDRVI